MTFAQCSWPCALAILTSTLCLVIIARCLAAYLVDAYRLRRFPAYPALAGMSDLAYIAHNALLPYGVARTEALHAAHKRFGPIIRLGPTRLSFSSPEAARDIYGTGTKLLKGDQYETPAGARNLLSVTDKAEHRVKRKRLSAAFATSHLVEWEHKISDKVERLLFQFDARLGQSIDFRQWSNFFTLDAIMDIALSHDSGFMEAGNDRIEFGSVLPGKHKSTVDSCRHVVECRKKSGQLPFGTGGALDDLFACLLRDAKSQVLHVPVEELLAETSHLLDAGSDTTSIALTHVIFCLARHPSTLAHLREELGSTMFSDQIVPSYSQVKSLPYLRACLDESMRLRPALSAGMQRVTPEGGATVAGQFIPGGVNVSVAAHIVHRDPLTVGLDFDVFRPERWLDKEHRSKLQRNSMTFSMGARVCIGKNITYMEQMMLVAAIFRRYDMQLPTRDYQIRWEEFINLWPKKLPLTLRYRDQ